MPQYLAVYTGSAEASKQSGWDALSPDEIAARQAEGMAQWDAWVARNTDAIVLAGGPLGKTTRVNRDGVANASNNLAAFVIVEAQSAEAAAELFRDHPHFSIFPGDGVDVMECLPVPGQ